MSRLPNLPTILTWLRIVLIPLVLGVYYLPWPEQAQNLWACVFFAISAATDWFDGYLARRWGQTSVFGAWLDTLADKLLVAACMVALLQLGRIDMLVALIIIGREITISALREWMAKIGASGSVAVAAIGKWKAAAQLLAIGFLLYHQDLWGLPVFTIGTVLAWLAALLTIWSMIYYLLKAWPAIRAKQVD